MVTVECICPPKATGEVRHPDGDQIELRERLDFRSALTARNEIGLLKEEDPDASVGEILAALTETFVLAGVRTWTVVDDKGKKVEVSRPAIRAYLLVNVDAAMAVGEEADTLYRDAVIAPLVARASSSSRTSSTDGSTSATNGSLQPAPKPSKRSSTSTTQTDGIATTL